MKYYGSPHPDGHGNERIGCLYNQVRSGWPAGRCASRRPTRGTRRNGASFGEKSGWERVNWFDSNVADGDETLRPRGWAGQQLVAGDRGRVHRSQRARRADRPIVVREARRARARRVRVPRPHVRERRSTARSGRSSTRSCSTRAAASRPTSPSCGSARTATCTSRARRSARTTWPGCASTCPTTGRSSSTTSRSARTCFCLWGPRGARHPAAADEDRPLATRRSRYMQARRDRRRPVPLLASRVTYVGELGWELYAPAEYGLGALRPALGGRRAARPARRRLRAIESMRLEKGYRAWGTDLTPETTPESAGVGFAVRLDKARRSSGRTRCAQSARPAARGERLACLVLEDAALGLPRLGAGAHRRRAVRPRHLRRLRQPRAAQHRARLRARGARAVGTRAEVEVFGEWVRAEVVERRALRSGWGAHSRLDGGGLLERLTCSSTTTCISRPTAPRSARRSSRLRAWRCTPRAPASAASTTSA